MCSSGTPYAVTYSTGLHSSLTHTAISHIKPAKEQATCSKTLCDTYLSPSSLPLSLCAWEGGKYCLDVTWQTGSLKNQGKWWLYRHYCPELASSCLSCACPDTEPPLRRLALVDEREALCRRKRASAACLASPIAVAPMVTRSVDATRHAWITLPIATE